MSCCWATGQWLGCGGSNRHRQPGRFDYVLDAGRVEESPIGPAMAASECQKSAVRTLKDLRTIGLGCPDGGI